MRFAIKPATFKMNCLSFSKIRWLQRFILFFALFSDIIFNDKSPMKRYTLFILLIFAFGVHAQIPDHVYKSNIRTIKLFKYGDIYGYPVLTLNSNDQLELHFDDMDGDVKYYYYSYAMQTGHRLMFSHLIISGVFKVIASVIIAPHQLCRPVTLITRLFFPREIHLLLKAGTIC